MDLSRERRAIVWITRLAETLSRDLGLPLEAFLGPDWDAYDVESLWVDLGGEGGYA